MTCFRPMKQEEMSTTSRRSIRQRLAAAAIFCLLSTYVFAEFPKPSGPINDFAGVLDQPAREELTKLSADVEADTTSEIAVATVTSLDGMSVEEYANRRFR